MLKKLGSKVFINLGRSNKNVAWFTCGHSAGVRRSHAWSSTAAKAISGQLKTIEEEGTWKKERIITGRQGAHIRTLEHPTRQVINFCANNYLGLSVRKKERREEKLMEVDTQRRPITAISISISESP